MAREGGLLRTIEHAPATFTVVKIAVCAMWAAVVLGVLLLAAPNNPMLPRAQHRNTMLLLLPQGWAFFTLDPREADTFLHRELADGDVREVETQGYREIPLGAVDREGRLVGHELRLLAARFADDVWTECRGEVASCLAALPPAPVRLAEPFDFVPACGRLVLESRPPTPWAWWRRDPELRMPSRLIRLEVPCVP
jgi:antimicrobial peptide system SdpA family protein